MTSMAACASISGRSSTRRVLPAVGLFVLAPLVGEFLLGNLPITWLGTLALLAPLYGGGALFIRELIRRMRLGWPSILMLGLAYALIEEGLVTHSLFNPDYAGLRLLDYGYMPALGVGAWWTVYVLGLHTVWSTAVPIALVEAMTPGGRRIPWLGNAGLALTAGVFVAGCLITARVQEPGAVEASVAQLTASALVVAALVLGALVAARRVPPARVMAAPQVDLTLSPFRVGVTSLACGSWFMGLAIVHSMLPVAVNVAMMLGAWLLLGCLLTRWSRTTTWSESHRCAAASGLLLTYAWYCFVQQPSVGAASPVVDRIGDIVWSAGAVLLVVAASRASTRLDRRTRRV